MLVRDEADAIANALAGALPFVDHVTLLDTGSVDDTLEIAHGDELPDAPRVETILPAVVPDDGE